MLFWHQLGLSTSCTWLDRQVSYSIHHCRAPRSYHFSGYCHWKVLGALHGKWKLWLRSCIQIPIEYYLQYIPSSLLPESKSESDCLYSCLDGRQASGSESEAVTASRTWPRVSLLCLPKAMLLFSKLHWPDNAHCTCPCHLLPCVFQPKALINKLKCNFHNFRSDTREPLLCLLPLRIDFA